MPVTAASVSGCVVATLRAPSGSRDRLGFVSTRVERLDLDHGGIPGDRHHGASRVAGPRERWLPRGTSLRNDRQLSALSVDDLATVAASLDLDRLPPEWLGGNLLVEGIAAFSHIAPGSQFAIGGVWSGKGCFDGGCVLRVEAYNVPCRLTGRAIAAATGRPELEFAFVKAAARLRGLVLSVTMPGPVVPGDAVVVIPPLVPCG